ncbi:uncharacterized protein LOC119371983 isoform X3 [Rhipicephalus sanguineus]|uniref:uncharacterized protein LOC119371983 isoform X3 n=1 Tax=Rhipicephalus sanguineus TaxID=34632 RepID=UPI0020C34241|nr:uncharacterized protein LOC119371983 isoform X3 [Rhipicephalus sanguineus]
MQRFLWKMDRACTFRALLPFVIGYCVPSIYVLIAMAYRLCYDFEEVVYTDEGVTNVFTSISRVTATPPWSVGWVAATVVHLACIVWINSDFAYFWYARETLLPQGERDVYRSAVQFARHLQWQGAVALVLISTVPVNYSLTLHFTFVTTYFVADVLYLRTVDDLEAELLACCKDSMVSSLYFHHRAANNVMKVMTVCILLNLVAFYVATLSYAHSVFGVFELIYGSCRGWHDLVTSVLIIRQAYLDRAECRRTIHA